MSTLPYSPQASCRRPRPGFFYSCFSHPPDAEPGVVPAEAKHRVCFHRVGQPQSGDLVVYEEGRADAAAGAKAAKEGAAMEVLAAAAELKE